MKLKAFTLLELMVGIIISGFVIGAGYSVFVFSNTYLTKSKSIKVSMLNYFEFSKTLQNDIEKADRIFKISDYQVQIHTKKDKIEYEFNNEMTLRIKNNYTDTFNIPVQNVHIESQINTWVNHINLSSEKEQFNFFKDYGAIPFIETN